MPYCPVELVQSRLTVYRSSTEDLTRNTVIHCSDICQLEKPCSLIHFGFCERITKDEFVKLKGKVKENKANLTFKKIPSEDKQVEEQKAFEQKEKVINQTEITKPDDVFKPQKIKKEVPKAVSPPPPKTQQKPTTASAIKPFYFPYGKPSNTEAKDLERVLKAVSKLFDAANDKKLTKNNAADLAKACELPFYWKMPLFSYISEGAESITFNTFSNKWKIMHEKCHDKASRFVFLLASGKSFHLVFDDFLPLMQDVVDHHPGLVFLQDAPEFHSRYIQTVIARIYFTLNKTWSGKICIQEVRQSNLLQVIERLETEDDINKILDFFSYEHFYVIYCKFWELDKDHDLLISEADLGAHHNRAISSRIIKRIFSGVVTNNLVDEKLTYRDFVWFLIAEEDKRHPKSIEYWFRCMDLDGDGILSMYEMEYFYEEQLKKMELLDIETLPFDDCLCQMIDMISPQEEGKIRLRDLKKCPLTPLFFDTFFNLEKYLRHEQKDPFADDDGELNDFEKFAAEEYELLVAEEASGEFEQADVLYDDTAEDPK